MIIRRHILPVEEVIPDGVSLVGILEKIDQLHEAINVTYADFTSDGETELAITIEYDIESSLPREWRLSSAYRTYIELLVENVEAAQSSQTADSKLRWTRTRIDNFTKALKKSE